MKKCLCLLTSLVAFSSISLAANWQSMNKAEVEQAFVGKTWTTAAIGHMDEQFISKNQFTGSWDRQGHFYGKYSQPINNGPQTDAGTYRVKNDGEVCMKFQHWNEAKEFCTHIYQTNDAYIIVGTENNLHNVVLKKGVRAGNLLK